MRRVEDLRRTAAKELIHDRWKVRNAATSVSAVSGAVEAPQHEHRHERDQRGVGPAAEVQRREDEKPNR